MLTRDTENNPVCFDSVPQNHPCTGREPSQECRVRCFALNPNLKSTFRTVAPRLAGLASQSERDRNQKPSQFHATPNNESERNRSVGNIHNAP